MYDATPFDGRLGLEERPTTAIVLHSSRICWIASLLLISNAHSPLNDGTKAEPFRVFSCRFYMEVWDCTKEKLLEISHRTKNYNRENT